MTVLPFNCAYCNTNIFVEGVTDLLHLHDVHQMCHFQHQIENANKEKKAQLTTGIPPKPFAPVYQNIKAPYTHVYAYQKPTSFEPIKPRLELAIRCGICNQRLTYHTHLKGYLCTNKHFNEVPQKVDGAELASELTELNETFMDLHDKMQEW